MRTGTVLLSLCFAASTAGCDCTLVGCGSELQLAIPGAWPEGLYEVAVDLGDRPAWCTFSVPSTLGTDFLNANCSEGLHGFLSPDKTATIGVVATRAENVGVRIARDGALLLERELPVSYSEHKPNGELCEPTCRSALVTVELPTS